MQKIHHKKVWKEYFDKMISGLKKFELRLANFDVHEGDTLILEEWDQEKNQYTGRTMEATATYILKTKDLEFWPQEEIDQHGFQIIQFTAKTAWPRGVEVTSGCVIQKEGLILLTRSPKWQNKWTMPGGHVDPGETILDAAVREAEEETGLKTKPIGIFNYGELINRKDFHRPAHLVYFDCALDVIGGELKLLKRELSDYLWTTPEEALKLDLASLYSDTIQKYIKYVKEL